MKARHVKGLDGTGGLADNVERIARQRVDELYGFVPAVLDEDEVTALHDMRIAAKRLRYVLEATAAACFGPYALTAAKRARSLQDLIGEIHDCDTALPRIEREIAGIVGADAAALLARAGDAPDLDPALAGGLPHVDEYRGLATLQVYLVARRRLLYRRFLELWQDLQREGFRARIEFALAERPESFTPGSPDGNVTVTPPT